MSTPTFAKTHNLIAFLEKPSESDGFEQIINFLNANPIKYALMVSPIIYTTCIKQFWTTLKIKTANDDVRLQTLIDGKKVVITEDSIRHDLKLNDAKGTSCLHNAVIFKELARIGAKTTSWNEFSSTIASAIICLANNQKFNFSKYILDNLKKNLEVDVPFYMFPRKHKPRRKEMKETKVSPTELHTEDHVPTTSNDPLPSEMKSSHKAKIAKLESRVKKFEEENRSLSKDLKSFNTKVESLEMAEVITTAKIIVDEVSTVGGELNALNEEPGKEIVFHDMEESTKRIASLKSQVKDKGPKIDAERINAPRKDKVEKDQTARKKKADELEKDNAEETKAKRIIGS
nr:hypothetical protein [Tanacetum cinerariifolium]